MRKWDTAYGLERSLIRVAREANPFTTRHQPPFEPEHLDHLGKLSQRDANQYGIWRSFPNG